MNSPFPFRQRLQIVLFTLWDPELNAVNNTTADVLHVQGVLEVMARGWESLNAKAELARMHRDGHCHETMVLYRPTLERATKGRRPKDRS